MTKTKFQAVILAVAVAVGGVSFTQFASAENVSAAVAKPLDAANKAIKAGKWDDAVARLHEVGAVGSKTAYDTYVMNKLLSFALIKQNKYADAVVPMEANLASPQSSAAEKTQLNKELLSIYVSLKNYPKVIETGQVLIASGAADAPAMGAIAQAYEHQGKLGDAVKLVKGNIDSAIAHGQKPKENDFLMLLDYQRRLKDANGEGDTFEKLVSYYPKGDYWANLVPALLKAPGNTDTLTLDIYRLMYSTGILKRGEDYTEMAQLCIEQGTTGEGLEVLQKAVAANIFTEQRDKERNLRLIESAKKQVAADQAGLAKTESAAQSDKSGDADVHLGQVYFGLGQYDKAADALKRGLGKGGLKSSEDAQLLLGIALLKGKKAEDAYKAFKSVKSSDPKYVRLANLWALHAKA